MNPKTPYNVYNPFISIFLNIYLLNNLSKTNYVVCSEDYLWSFQNDGEYATILFPQFLLCIFSTILLIEYDSYKIKLWNFHLHYRINFKFLWTSLFPSFCFHILQVVDKFYEIGQHSLEGFEDASWDDKCTWLLHGSAEMWSYNDTSTSKYIVTSHDLCFGLFCKYTQCHHHTTHVALDHLGLHIC